MTVHETLCKARNLIDRHGWCQHSFARGGMYCTLGAIKAVAKLDYQCREVLLSVLKVESVANWNDAPGRTKQEVLDAFDRAIAATAPLPEDLFLSELVEEARVHPDACGCPECIGLSRALAARESA